MRTTERFERQQRLNFIGPEGQQRIAAARIAVLGCGALGSVALEQLARAGVGLLRLIDRDVVELSNLHRQVLYTERDAAEGNPKADAAARRLQQINSSVHYEVRVADVTAHNVAELISGIDLVIDATDNFTTRYLLNEAALDAGVPWIHGGCVATGGQVLPIVPGCTACFQCLVPSAPPPGTTATCESVGVLGSATAVIASLQVVEALRIVLCGLPQTPPQTTVVDVWEGQFKALDTARLRDPDCPVCVHGERPHLQEADRAGPQILCGRNAVQLPPRGQRPDLERLAAAWQGLGTTSSNRYLARLQLEDFRLTVFRDGRAVIEGTDDPVAARVIFDRYTGG